MTIIPNAKLKNGRLLFNAYIDFNYLFPHVFAYDAGTLKHVCTKSHEVIWLDNSFELLVIELEKIKTLSGEKKNLMISQSIGNKVQNATDKVNDIDIFNAFIVGDTVYGFDERNNPITAKSHTVVWNDSAECDSDCGQTIDWEQRRYEIAKEYLCSCSLSDKMCGCNLDDADTRSALCKKAILMADTLIEQLRKKV